MNLKEYAELNNLTMPEAKAKTGLTHWKQEVAPAITEKKMNELTDELINSPLPESCDEIEEVAEDVVIEDTPVPKPSDVIKEAQVVMKMLMKDGITAELAIIGIKMIGLKSKYFNY